MKRFFLFIMLASVLLAAGELQPVAWNKNLMIPSRYATNTSGSMKASFDVKENALRFDVTFDPKRHDYWIYPKFILQPKEDISKAEILRFDIRAEQSDDAKGYNDANVMFGGGNPYYKIPHATREWQTIEIDLKKAVKDRSTIKEIRIGMNPNSPKLTYWIKNIKVLTSEEVYHELEADELIVASAPVTAFLVNEKLSFTQKAPFSLPGKWLLKDWQGNVLDSGTWPQDGKGALVLKPLPEGYYSLSFTSPQAKVTGRRTFTVLPALAARTKNPDGYFCVDSAQTTVAWAHPTNMRHPQDGYDEASVAAWRMGVPVVRDRLYWGGVEKERGVFNWGAYGENADKLAQNGVKVSWLLIGSPKHASGKGKLPVDMVALYKMARQMAIDLKGSAEDFEYWNEPDLGSAPEGAWVYAACMKAAFLGFKAGNPDVPVTLGSFADPSMPNYSHVVLSNGLKDYFDILNVHTYGDLKGYPDMMKKIRNYQKKFGIEDRPVWFTESGTMAEGASKDECTYMAGYKCHSAEQELIVAEFFPKMMVIMQSLGVDRDFAFLLVPYSEWGGAKDWGMMRRDFTVKPVYTAISTLTCELGAAKYLGPMNLGKDLRGFLYQQPNGSQTLVYWSESELDKATRIEPKKNDPLARPFVIAAQNGVFQGREVFGTPFKAVAKGGRLSLTATRYPAFINGLRGLKPDRPFVAGKKAGAPKQVSYDRSIVLRPEFNEEEFVLSGPKDRLDLKKDIGTLVLEVWNLSDTPKTGTIKLDGGQLVQVPGEVTIKPFEKAEFKLTVKPEYDKDFFTVLRFSGSFNGKDISPLCVPVTSSGKLQAKSKAVPFLTMEDPANWRKNSSGTMTIDFDTKENALRFHTTFPKGNYWSYPEYVLQLPQESLRGAIGISFDVKISSSKAAYQMGVMTCESSKAGASYKYGKTTLPTEQWGTRFVPFDQIDPEKVKMLRIGLNGNVQDITYWIRNVKIHYRQ